MSEQFLPPDEKTLDTLKSIGANALDSLKKAEDACRLFDTTMKAFLDEVPYGDLERTEWPTVMAPVAALYFALPEAGEISSLLHGEI